MPRFVIIYSCHSCEPSGSKAALCLCPCPIVQIIKCSIAQMLKLRGYTLIIYNAKEKRKSLAMPNNYCSFAKIKPPWNRTRAKDTVIN